MLSSWTPYLANWSSSAWWNPEAAARLRWVTGGCLSHPTVEVAGEVLVEPSLNELDWALGRVGLR